MPEKREDRRIRHTKRAIKNAFFELMDEKPVDKISVTELCERADINRSSFYAHYVDYPAFLDELECEIAEKNIELFADLYMRPDYSKVIVGNMLQLIKTKKEMKLFFSDYGNHKGVTRLNEYVYAKAMPMWLKSGVTDTAKAEMLFLYVIRGGYAILKQWYDSDFAMPEVEVNELLTTVITHGLYSFVHIKL